MERKIGEIFEYNGEWYQCVEDSLNRCVNCCFFNGGYKECSDELGECSKGCRGDETSVIFKKLEKVGEPYMLEDKKFQKYKVFKTPYIYHKIDCSWQSFADPYYISLEIKKDMEEKKLNLKPFDIQKAREGKPVCTRDGRKARIICFDWKSDTSIVALIMGDNDREEIHSYYKNGKSVRNQEYSCDLMMYPEKKEGWVNVYKERIYSTKEEAIEATYDGVTYVDTVKICWEE